MPVVLSLPPLMVARGTRAAFGVTGILGAPGAAMFSGRPPSWGNNGCEPAGRPSSYRAEVIPAVTGRDPVKPNMLVLPPAANWGPVPWLCGAPLLWAVPPGFCVSEF